MSDSSISLHSNSISDSINRIKQYETSIKKNSYNYFIIILIALILGISLYLIIFTIYYFKEKCHIKKSFGAFISSFNLNTSPCNLRNKPEYKPTIKLDTTDKKEVFHISNQLYNYNDAQCKCASYGAELADKHQIIDAYNKGASWCSYGWSKGQSAYYPTQKCIWDDLQKTKNKNICGNPGINGGKFPASVKFGANCYGYKPKGKIIKEKNPECKKVAFCKENKDLSVLDTDNIVDFSSKKWSSFD